ncbi:MAG: hypothetical protein LAO77_02490 [Acidobacteriia bacterium]|nr:hypothetical protein [Terriglobia bacterium]
MPDPWGNAAASPLFRLIIGSGDGRVKRETRLAARRYRGLVEGFRDFDFGVDFDFAVVDLFAPVFFFTAGFFAAPDAAPEAAPEADPLEFAAAPDEDTRDECFARCVVRFLVWRVCVLG